MTPIVTLLTDFGAGSGYPAQMKAVILSRLPEARLVDLSHEVPHYDLLAGALLLEACVPWFPPGAVHCAVVDPGVGTARRAICAVTVDGRRLVGPDNGLLTPFLDGARVFELASPAGPPVPSAAERGAAESEDGWPTRLPRSPTFHGRDLFAPVAAFLAGGGEPERLGPRVQDPVRLAWPRAAREGDRVRGEVLAADPFGNLLTSIRQADLDGPPATVEIAGRAARFVRTFGEGEPGELLALVGSSGRLELAVREGSAARELGAGRGALVLVRTRG